MKKFITLMFLIGILSWQSFAQVNYFFDGFTRKNGNWVGTETPVNWWANMKWFYSEWSAGDHKNECYNNMWHVWPGYADWNWTSIRPANVDLEECAFSIADEIGLTSKIDIYDWIIFEYTNQPPTETNLVIDASFMSSILNIPSKGNPSDYSATGLVVHVGLDVNTNSAYNLEIFLNRKDFSNSTQGTTLYFTNVSYIIGKTLSLNFNTNTAVVSYGETVLFEVEHHLKGVELENWFPGYCVQNVQSARAEYFFDNVEVIGTEASYGDYLENSFTGSDGAQPDSNIWFLTTYSPSEIENNMCEMYPTNISWQGTMIGYKSDVDNSLRFDSTLSELDISLRIMDVEIINTGTWDYTTIFKTEFFPERSRVKSYERYFCNAQNRKRK